MKNRTLIPALFVGSLLLAVACGDDEDGNPTPPDVGGSAGTKNTGGSAGTKNTGGSTGNNGGAPSDAGNGPGPTDGGEPPVNVGGQGGEGPAPTCDPFTGEDGCFNCPSEPVQYLNRCVDGDCVEFPNADRLPLLEANGSLPDLPN
jgi:hypothetical protein